MLSEEEGGMMTMSGEFAQKNRWGLKGGGGIASLVKLAKRHEEADQVSAFRRWRNLFLIMD